MTGPRLHLVGDSTMADRPADPALIERGWGQLLPTLFREPERVVNHAVNGRSTRSFTAEGRWERVLADLKPGDFVLVQFGHNDQKAEDPSRYADATTDFPANLARMVADVQGGGGHMLLATQVSRRRFLGASLAITLAPYPEAVRTVAREHGVPVIELYSVTRFFWSWLGPEPSKRYFAQDETHLNEAGALLVAGMAADQLKSLHHPLAALLV